jgi:hypothetical protein
MGCAQSGCGVSGPIIRVPTITPSTPSVSVGVGGHGGVNVVTNNVVVSHVSPSISVTSGVSGGGGDILVLRGGGGVEVGGAASIGQIGPIGAEAESVQMVKRSRTTEETRAIRAVCYDDTNNPHPASQTFAGATVPDGYTGEIYRCMAGTRMEYMMGSVVNGKPVFDGAVSYSCKKGEALVRDGANLSCRVQEQKRQCNERSLLRRFGVGDKVLVVRSTEHFEERQVSRQSQQLGAGMSLDGGVGQGVF